MKFAGIGKNWRLNCVKLFSVTLLVGILIGCATTPPAPKELPPPVTYNFNFNPPERATQKQQITIGIVAPQWDEKIGLGEGKMPWGDAGFCPNPNELLLYPNLTAHAHNFPRDLYDVAHAFHKAIERDFEAMIIARGFDVMGPFKNIDEMTYPQKQACNLIIVPEFSQVIRSQTTSVFLGLVEGSAQSRTEIVLNVYDPLSKEKLWKKSFTNTSDSFQYKIEFDYQDIYRNKEKYGVQRKGITWDNRAASFARAEENLYKEFFEKSWSYFNPEEMKVLKKHSDDLREKKRF